MCSLIHDTKIPSVLLSAMVEASRLELQFKNKTVQLMGAGVTVCAAC